jgi:Anhydro-N-acetylmuramic acid kinase
MIRGGATEPDIRKSWPTAVFSRTLVCSGVQAANCALIGRALCFRPLLGAFARIGRIAAPWILSDLGHRPPRLAILCGGGAHNLTLRWQLMQLLPCGLVTADALGWSGDAIEAQAFAYLAVRSLKNLPITFPSTTGIDRPLNGGRLALPA